MSEKIIAFPTPETPKKGAGAAAPGEFATGDPILRKAGSFWARLKKHEQETEAQGKALEEKFTQGTEAQILKETPGEEQEPRRSVA